MFNLKKSHLEDKEILFSRAALPKAAGAQQLSQQKQQSHVSWKGCSCCWCECVFGLACKGVDAQRCSHPSAHGRSSACSGPGEDKLSSTLGFPREQGTHPPHAPPALLPPDKGYKDHRELSPTACKGLGCTADCTCQLCSKWVFTGQGSAGSKSKCYF